MKKISKLFYISFFYSILTAGNIYWYPEKPVKNDEVTIYVDTSNDKNYFLSYPMYIHLDMNDLIITKTMALDYLKGPSIWSYSLPIDKIISFSISNSPTFDKKNNLDSFEIKINKEEHNNIFDNALFFLNNNDYHNTIKEINTIILESENLLIKSKAEYMLAEIYLNDFNNYELSANQFNKIINIYPDTLNVVKKSYFTLAYIYSNYLDYYSKSIELYNQFLIKYPNDELVESINYELDLLSKVNVTIDSLLNISK